jgi:hypothetical protein
MVAIKKMIIKKRKANVDQPVAIPAQVASWRSFPGGFLKDFLSCDAVSVVAERS